LKIATDNREAFTPLLDKAFKSIVYIGRGGADMHMAVALLFKALKKCLNTDPILFSRLRFYFIGTSYAPAGQGTPTILPLAKKHGVENNIIEITDRISYYHTLLTLQQADALFIPGSDDPNYTASKIYPYLLTQKPLLAILNRQSSMVSILEQCTLGATVLTIPGDNNATDNRLRTLLTDWAHGNMQSIQLTSLFENYSARSLTMQQVKTFNNVLEKSFLNQGT
jgi:hypothetical protein